MDVRSLLRVEFDRAHGLAPRLDDCPPEVLLARLPGATLGSIGEIYAHAVMAEDIALSQRAFRKEPLYTEWRTRLGMPALQSARQTEDWSTVVHFELPLFEEYARTVFAATDAGISRLTDADLEREVDYIGPRSVAATLGMMVQHFAGHCGEIAALKGVQGLKGLPF
jgi:hypothetical protein